VISVCPNCGSERTRRGGNAIWGVYVILIALAIPAVVVWHLNAALVAGIMIAVVVLAHLLFDTRVWLECGTQWRAR
jgi:cobalamin biosynthesis protein CobD/CbiB